MDKNSAANQIANANVDTYDIANSIYQATVQGISGANQNDGYGFLLSAIAELWNIRGTIGNPHGRTKITGRYKGMNVTENMILNVISQYPNGLRGDEPLFDDLLGISLGKIRKTTYTPQMVYDNSDSDGMQNDFDRQDRLLAIGAVIGFVICKFVLHFGWILSIVLAILLGGLFMYWGSRK